MIYEKDPAVIYNLSVWDEVYHNCLSPTYFLQEATISINKVWKKNSIDFRPTIPPPQSSSSFDFKSPSTNCILYFWRWILHYSSMTALQSSRLNEDQFLRNILQPDQSQLNGLTVINISDQPGQKGGKHKASKLNWWSVNQNCPYIHPLEGLMQTTLVIKRDH